MQVENVKLKLNLPARKVTFMNPKSEMELEVTQGVVTLPPITDA